MRIKLDTFTWVVLAVVVLLVVGALVSVSFMGQDSEQAAYMEDNTPVTPVYNALLAAQRGEMARVRAQFTPEVLEGYQKQGYDPIANALTHYADSNNARRMRILGVESIEKVGALNADGTPEVADPNVEQAYVTISEDYFYSGGLFDRSTYSNTRYVRVEKVDGIWKVADPNLFF